MANDATGKRDQSDSREIEAELSFDRDSAYEYRRAFVLAGAESLITMSARKPRKKQRRGESLRQVERALCDSA
ncbi:MAG: hypothetical protein WBV94_30550 [Blastocatellia bacterium]